MKRKIDFSSYLVSIFTIFGIEVNIMDKFKMELTWHNCKTCPPEEAYNPLIIYTDGYNVDYCAYHKKYGFPIGEDMLHKFWWADVSRTVRESDEFKALCHKYDTWSPSDGEFFWHIDSFGNPVIKTWTGCNHHLNLYKIGNCYHTEAEAKVDRDKWLAFYTSDEVLEV